MNVWSGETDVYYSLLPSLREDKQQQYRRNVKRSRDKSLDPLAHQKIPATLVLQYHGEEGFPQMENKQIKEPENYLTYF